jgi:hypothetical protein
MVGCAVLLAGASLFAGLLGLVLYLHIASRGAAPPSDLVEGPFLNVRPGVRYVGDASCANCHPQISATYRRHPMARSLTLASGAEAIPNPSAPRSFEALGLHYAVGMKNDQVTHRESARGPDGKVVAERCGPVRYVVGSGARGHSYLIEEDGCLFLSPVSWYARHGWELSPGYREQNQHFDRPVPPNCLFCHANHADPIEDTLNRYRIQTFRSDPIGCERCHGPGELHVRRHTEGGADGEGVDFTIVNPRHLEPALREAVCHQCHLQGQARILGRGQGPFDFRPGLALERFCTVFVWNPKVPQGQKAVGQVEQMVESGCYKGSAAKLGCISCHDPHEKPAPASAGAYYRARCLQCHTSTSCTAAPAERRQKQDACAVCHMPGLPTGDVAHVSITDHRILRRPTTALQPQAQAMLPGEFPLVPFMGDLAPGQRPAREDSRALGMALVELALQSPAGPSRASLSRLALPLLREAANADDDVPAREARGLALHWVGWRPEALSAFEAILADHPHRERTLVGAATVAAELHRPAKAADYWRRAIEVGPRRWRYHHHLALALVELGDSAAALAASVAARRLNPVQTDVRLVEVAGLIEAGRRAEASAAFAALLALKPSRADELRKWFAGQQRRP